MKIIAIDPGYERVGIAILEKSNPPAGGETLIHSECFKTSAKIPHLERLRFIGEKVSAIISEFAPQALAIEKLFFNTNTTTALMVAEARGVVLYCAALADLPVYEYTPLQIKMAVTGYGRSDKQQMMSMIPKLITIDKKIRGEKMSDDEFDAIACGLTHFAVVK